MTETDAWAWLIAREPDMPDALRARMQEVLESVAEPANDIARRFGLAATVCLERTLALGDERAAALDLLAADAFFTHGAEAAAESGSDALTSFASSFGAEALGRLLSEEPT
jgi:hypothetical protein